MKHQVAIQRLLQARMTEAKAKNAAFSLRAFAKKLGLSAAMVSRVLSGDRSVSARVAKKICDALLLDPEERAAILSRFPASRKDRARSRADEVDPGYLKLTSDHFRMISEWHYFAILSLFKTRVFQSSPRWIAERLGLPVTAIETALDRLKRLELIAETPEGKLELKQTHYRTPDDVVNLSLRKAHFESLELAKKSLEADPIEKRDFSSLTLAFPSNRMAEAKTKIREFEREFDSQFEGDGSGTNEVYRLSVSLFPLTKPSKE